MASKGHEIVVKANNYLSSLGFNNSTGKYDRIVHGVKGLLSSGFLEGADLDKAIKREVDRLLKKYNVTDNDTVGKMYYDPVMCMMVPDSVKTKDELSLAQKKQVVTELNGFLKKSYNFSDEREYARAYEDLRHMFTTGSRKSIYGLFENAVKKTGSRDGSIGNNVSDEKAIDKAIRSCDSDYIVSVKEASDRDASRVIGIAQEIGFSTVDKGYTVILKDGDDKMYSKFKREIVGIKGVKVL